MLIFWERARRPEQRSAEWEARQRRKVEGGVREIARLAGDHEFCLSDRFGLADIPVGTVLRYFDLRFPEFAWRHFYPNLVDLSWRLEQRPSFLASVRHAQTIRDMVA